MRTVSAASVAADRQSIEGCRRAVQEALGELAGAAKEGLLALSVGVGLGVLHELMEAEVDEVVGPKGKHDPDRAAVRHGHEGGEVTLGGRRVPVSRPRARSADGEQRGRAGHLRALRRARSAHRRDARADAGRRLDAPLRADRRAGRHRDRRARALDVEVGGQRASSSRARAST